MAIIRKTIKAYLIAIGVFLLLTIILASLIKFTAYRESWTFTGLVAALSITTFLLGVMEGKIMEKRGLLIGLASAVLFILIVLLTVGGIFAGGSETYRFDLPYLIPVLSGAVGGILGANSGQS